MNPLGILLKCKFCFWDMVKILPYQLFTDRTLSNQNLKVFTVHAPRETGGGKGWVIKHVLHRGASYIHY